MSKTITDDSEVAFDQPEKGAGIMEQKGPTPSRNNEETWVADTEPHQKDRRRAMEFDRPIGFGSGVHGGTASENNWP